MRKPRLLHKACPQTNRCSPPRPNARIKGQARRAIFLVWGTGADMRTSIPNKPARATGKDAEGDQSTGGVHGSRPCRLSPPGVALRPSAGEQGQRHARCHISTRHPSHVHRSGPGKPKGLEKTLQHRGPDTPKAHRSHADMAPRPDHGPPPGQGSHVSFLRRVALRPPPAARKTRVGRRVLPPRGHSPWCRMATDSQTQR